MDALKIQQALMRLYRDEQERIVFWNDPDREFQNDIPFLDLEGVETLFLDRIGALEVKYILEKKDTEGKYLVYAPTEEPDFENDWLLDIRIYSRSFRADRASIILDELKLNQQHLRDHLTLRRKFFDNKDRLQKLKELVLPNDNEDTLDLKMITVVCQAEQPELFSILRTLYTQLVNEGGDWETQPASWRQIEKFDLDTTFWALVKMQFEYEEENTSLKNLLMRMLLSEFNHQVVGELPVNYKHLILKKIGTRNVLGCLAQWRDSSSTANSLDELSQEIAQELDAPAILESYELEALKNVITFYDVEKVIISDLCKLIRSNADNIDLPAINEIIGRRQDGYWSSKKVNGNSKIPRSIIYDSYTALQVAAEFYALRNKYRNDFASGDALEIYHQYVEELYRFDQLYRHFCTAADSAEKLGWELLKGLRSELEDTYCNWFLLRLSLNWGKCITAGLLENWNLLDIKNQYRFYKNYVQPQIEKSPNFRVFVIISDALRYEVAQEIQTVLNGEYRISANLETQLGVVPSYTALGMASLLPGDHLVYEDSGDISIDGKPTASMEQRNVILQSIKGIAVKADELLEMKREEGRELIADSRVVYIYHNTIDSTGDTASTETNTFDAVKKTIVELVDIVRYVTDRLNGNHILITADHGFLFTERMPSETDKSKLIEKPQGSILTKKRFLIGRDIGDHQDVWHGRVKNTAGAKGEMEFWVPKGVNRFHFVGGARFIHGGVMPQEIVIPVLTVKHVKNKGVRGGTKTKKVSVQVLNDNHRITAPQHRFRLMQTEIISDRIKPVTLKIAVYEGNEPVTNIETVTFNSTSTDMNELQKEVILVLTNREFDKRTDYYLVLRDAESEVEYSRTKVIIDRVLTDEF